MEEQKQNGRPMSEEERDELLKEKRIRRMRRRSQEARKRTVMLRLIVMSVIVVILVAILIALIVKGIRAVSWQEATETTLTVQEDGTIVFEELTALDKEYYNAEELQDYVETAISDYNAEHGENSITLEKFSAEEDQVYLRTEYDSPEVYAGFTNYIFKVGTVGELKKSGETFEDTFAAVKDGKKGDRTESTEALSKEDSMAVVIRENVIVRVNGTIQYISDANTEILDNSTVKIFRESEEEDADAAVTAYIIYSKAE